MLGPRDCDGQCFLHFQYRQLKCRAASCYMQEEMPAVLSSCIYWFADHRTKAAKGSSRCAEEEHVAHPEHLDHYAVCAVPGRHADSAQRRGSARFAPG